MTEKQDLRSRLVVGRRRDGRREFDEAAVQELVELCLKPGVSIARAAMDHDVNPNQLRRWISRYRQQMLQASRDPDPMVIDGGSIDAPGPRVRSPVDMSPPPAFVPVVSSYAVDERRRSEKVAECVRCGNAAGQRSSAGIFQGSSAS